MLELTALQYQQALESLPSSDGARLRAFPGHKVKVAVMDDLNDKYLVMRNGIAHNTPPIYVKAIELEFELVMKYTRWHWQPTEPISIKRVDIR